jgi:protein ImuB
MLWLCIRLPQLAREALAGERAALERLAGWAYQWSSLVSYAPAKDVPSGETPPDHACREPLLWLELGASRALFGGYAALLARIEDELVRLDCSHVCALAPSPTAAALLTRAGGRHALTPAQLRALLDPLPLELLELPPATLAALTASGLRRIGEVLALPASAIARRFGPQALRYLRRLCATVSDPRPAWRLPPTYQARCEFGAEVRTSTALLFPLQRLLLEFQGYLRARDCSVQRFELEFEHYRQPSSRMTIGLSAPGRDAARFLTLVRERLHSLTLPASVSALRLSAHEFAAPAIVQTDLFGHDAQPQQQLQRLMDRLRARLGDDSLQSPTLAADYRPERGARCMTPERAVAGSANPQSPPRPCWLLREPLRVEAPRELLRGPERIESGWWDGADVSRDYYLARIGEGSRVWVFHDRRDGAWYLQGLWA